ncbi:hypothetical protein PG997_011122 [Apiospora hydei]|uniref:Cupin type-2 domain-containing protein n=1 Tax=Apiospora hydei TaxID=1337664 RepID=A0ABR1VI63_9PEZI
MVWGWQLWLSPRPTRRTRTPAEPRMLSVDDAALYEFNYEDGGRLFVRETHYADNPSVKAGLSGPPLHIHLRQTEFFEVEQGILVVVRNEQESVLTKEDGVVVIPPGTRHRFWAHSSNKGDLVFKVHAEPHEAEHGFDEAYLRNALGYLRDCQREKLEPSVFQLALFGCMSETVLTPPFWVPLWILSLLHHVLAYWIAAPLLGYQATYPEYSKEDQGDTHKWD